MMTLHIDPVHSISEDQTPAQTYYGQEPGQRGEQETSWATPATARSVSRTQLSFLIKEGERECTEVQAQRRDIILLR